jgi:hypothetical protein
MPKPLNQIDPNQAVALCTREQAEQRMNYDHHAIQVNARLSVMLTY